MDTQIQLFTNELFGSVRSFTDINNNIWFVGSDIAAALDYKDTTQAIRYHVLDEDKIIIQTNQNVPPVTDSLGRIQYPVWINESGLYSLIFGSKKQNAVEFKHWVTATVLPTMRKLGFDNSIRLLQTELAEKQNQINVLSQANVVAGNISFNNAYYRLKSEILEYNIIHCYELSEQSKVNLLTYDPTVVDPDIDLKQENDNYKKLRGIQQ